MNEAAHYIARGGSGTGEPRANGVPTDRVKVSLFVFTAFCATIFAATQVFDTTTADAAEGNRKELEAIAASWAGRSPGEPVRSGSCKRRR